MSLGVGSEVSKAHAIPGYLFLSASHLWIRHHLQLQPFACCCHVPHHGHHGLNFKSHNALFYKLTGLVFCLGNRKVAKTQDTEEKKQKLDAGPFFWPALIMLEHALQAAGEERSSNFTCVNSFGSCVLQSQPVNYVASSATEASLLWGYQLLPDCI